MDENGRRIPAHAVSGCGAYRAGRILRRYGLQPVVESDDTGRSVGVICQGGVRPKCSDGASEPDKPLSEASVGQPNLTPVSPKRR